MTGSGKFAQSGQPGPSGRDSYSRDVLEFDAILELVHRFLSGPLAEPLLARIEPRTDLEAIRRDHELCGEAREVLRESTRPSLGSLDDPRPIFPKLAIEGGSCTAFEILALVAVAKAARDLRGAFRKTPHAGLDMLAGRMADFRDLVEALDGKINPDGSVDSSASPALGRIRHSIEGLKLDIQSALERLLRRLTQAGVLQESVITIRNDRFVLPIRVEEKRRVDGIVHGASSSGATLYLEPMETVPLNNELVELQDAEFAEVQRILGEFTARLRVRGEEIAAAAEILSELDLAFAKAEFAREFECCLPEFSAGASRELVLAGVRHPLLDQALRAGGRKSVPLEIELKEPKTLVIVSGPNTGGKTVALKTVGVAALMAQSGLPVAASYARLPVFSRVLADIGDQQSIQANLSTFSAHVRNIQRMVEAADRDSLVLIDEIGSSTDPNEGAALAVAVLEHLRRGGATTFVTTHHSRLKSYAAETPAALNAAMEFDEATLQPTYRLLIGLPGKSSGLDIAARLGLEPSIVAQARTLIDPSEAQAAALVDSLHAKRSELEQEAGRLAQQRRDLEELERRRAEEFQRERRVKLKELDQRLDQTLRQQEEKWEATIAEIRAQLARAEAENRAVKAGKAGRSVAGLERKADRLRRETRDEWDAQVLEVLGEPARAPGATEPALKAPAVGDRVEVSRLPAPGRVIAVDDDGQVEIEVGRLRMRVPRDEVRVLGSGPSASPPLSSPTQVSRPDSVDAPAEINVIGTTADEAREQVDKFLDQAFLAGHSRLRVIHGFGKGILRKSLHEMFAGHPHVEKFYPAAPNEGGAGATIVELRA
ncbi:MAG TPA: Smr/MutS family protein [Terriglobia bacterium]|nr:Smr/MutS family protein [Terriglobia bacterium]